MNDRPTETASDMVVTAERQGEAMSGGRANSALYLRYFLIPFLFLTVAMLGGLRVDSADSRLVFLVPPLICLIFAVILLFIFVRTGVIALSGWFSEERSAVENAANGMVLITLFAASAQLFNSLIPEQGIAFWMVAFCFFWMLWNYLFAEFDARKIFKGLAALFGLAFVAKYIVLSGLTAPGGRTWFESLTEDPGREAITRLLDLPRYAGATGYIQFFTVALYMLGLYLFPRSPESSKTNLIVLP